MTIPNLSNYVGEHPLQVSEQFQLRSALYFYDHCVILKKTLKNGGMTEYAIDPDSLAKVLSAKVEFSTGLLHPDTLSVRQEGAVRTVVQYRKPQITAIWLDGMEAALRVPFPALVMRRVTREDKSPSYSIFAVKKRPTSPDEVLYQAPLPNTGGNGTCWGTVARPSEAELKGSSLERDWEQFLGSPFNNHQVGRKSKKYEKDIRQMYEWLVEAGKKRYPKSDLVQSNYTFNDLIKGNRF